MSLRLLVIVGTDVHPFPRMVRAVDRWASRRASEASCFVQYGHSSPPAHTHGEAFLAHDDLEKRLSEADFLLCHGGPSTISEARRRGLRPIVLPRRAQFGEHVDDHQHLFVHRLAADGLVHPVGDEDEVLHALDRGIDDPAAMRLADADGSAADASVRRFAALVDGLFAG